MTTPKEDRRRARRQDADFPASLAIADHGEWNGMVDNISVTGALVTMDPVDVDDTRLRPGTRVVFRCQYFFVEMMECHSTIAWSHGDAEKIAVGLCFENLRDTDFKRIQRFVG